MIAFDICARSISYPLCLISEFSSIIEIKTLLALPSMCHITSIFSKNHGQFLGTSTPWAYLKFQIFPPCCMNWSCALWDDMWPVEIHCSSIFSPQLKPCKDLFLPYLCGTYLWFLSNPIKFILPVVEEWSFGLCRIMSSSKLAGIGKVGLGVQAEYTFPVSSSILCCLLNFNFKWKLRILIQSHYFVAEWLKHSMSASLGVCF